MSPQQQGLSEDNTAVQHKATQEKGLVWEL
jgi:hypothetical protein